MGMLTNIAAIVFINSIERVNLGPRLGSWYTPYGMATMALLISIAVCAFWRSVGSRTLEDEPGR
jgi:hypothetical protein